MYYINFFFLKFKATKCNTMNTQPIVKSAAESNTGPGKIKNSYFILTHSYFLYQLYIYLHI